MNFSNPAVEGAGILVTSWKPSHLGDVEGIKFLSGKGQPKRMEIMIWSPSFYSSLKEQLPPPHLDYLDLQDWPGIPNQGWQVDQK